MVKSSPMLDNWNARDSYIYSRQVFVTELTSERLLDQFLFSVKPLT